MATCWVSARLWYKMHWFEMAARVPLVVHAPQAFAARRVAAGVSTIDLLPTLVELAGGLNRARAGDWTVARWCRTCKAAWA